VLTNDGDGAQEWPPRRFGRFLVGRHTGLNSAPLLGPFALAVPRRASREGAITIHDSRQKSSFIIDYNTVYEVFNC